ncbi:MAG: bifunctional diaminohydroxyphosphoribosylaminopyrimidine deaminase/5-amino-6-(5-phosphoribosylamino)uracil reductase RibD [Proteobacteria bacterium]|nr:bifunctional diaminohydroxyphosphoribosylaminopyrimidine deaminase/5-amino-6-(5-phosphoribosylamino)uracil reductase RibD [Pseudomonadota bacterium]
MRSNPKPGRGVLPADARWMREALGLAARARGRTAPNPLVGALVVRGDRRLASGYHRRAGEAHAEALALERAGRAARGATLYVTLEPCAHRGRTPPCVDAVLEARPRRVVVGMRDPDPRTAGRGIARLRRAGIEVAVGVEAEACRDLNRGFVSRLERGRPFTSLKLAASLDGRIATRSGASRWITGPEARAEVHRLRGRVDAIAVGSGTVLADDPELSARRAGRVVHRPRRIVVDSRARTPRTARLLLPEQGSEPAWILTSRDAPRRRRAGLERAGARLIDVGARDGHLNLAAAWRRLARLGVCDLLVEGGGGLAAALLRAKLVDRVHFFTAPLLIGADGAPALDVLGVGALADAVRLGRVRTRRLGADWLVVAEV